MKSANHFKLKLLYEGRNASNSTCEILLTTECNTYSFHSASLHLPQMQACSTCSRLACFRSPSWQSVLLGKVEATILDLSQQLSPHPYYRLPCTLEATVWKAEVTQGFLLYSNDRQYAHSVTEINLTQHPHENRAREMGRRPNHSQCLPQPWKKQNGYHYTVL